MLPRRAQPEPRRRCEPPRRRPAGTTSAAGPSPSGTCSPRRAGSSSSRISSPGSSVVSVAVGLVGKPVEVGERELAARRVQARVEREQRGRDVGRMRRGAEVVREDRVLAVLALARVAAVAAVEAARILRAASTSSGSTGAGCRRSSPCCGAAATPRAGTPRAAPPGIPASTSSSASVVPAPIRSPLTPRGTIPRMSTSVSACEDPVAEERHDLGAAVDEQRRRRARRR